MKKKYVFFGQVCEIGDAVKLNRFGQEVELTEKLAADIPSVIPKDIFDKVGFDPADYQSRRSVRRSDDFVVKFEKLLQLHRDWTASLSIDKAAHVPTGAVDSKSIPSPAKKQGDV